jgi:hypothetical protein
VVFSTSTANNYVAAVVTEDFTKGGDWDRNRTTFERIGTGWTNKFNNYPLDWDNYYYQSVSLRNLEPISELQRNAGNLQRLESSACMRAYGQSMYENKWRNFLVVTNTSTFSDGLLTVFEHSVASTTNDVNWMCLGPWPANIQGDGSCNINRLAASDWVLYNISAGGTYNLTTGSAHPVNVTVAYCLAEEQFSGHCSIVVSPALLAVVVICNAVKLASILLTLRLANFEPLASVGDAIKSFLNEPDMASVGKGALSATEVWAGLTNRLNTEPLSWRWEPQTFRRKAHFWGAAAGLQRWIWFIIL